MAGIGKPTAGAPMQRASSKQEKLVSLNSLVGGSKQPASPPKSAPRPLPGKEMSRPSIPSPSEINDQDSEAPGQPVVLATKPSAQRLSKPAASQKGTPMASTPQGDVPARKGPAVGGPAQGGHVKGDSIERAMKSELHAVQDKFGPTPRKAAAKKAPAPGQEKILSKEPDSMDDILRDLVRVDQYIKASALVKRDGTLLASEISSNLSDSLVSIIATTVTTIAKDVIFATESGELKHIMFSGTTGIVYVVPVVNDIFLVLQTSNVSKKGIIEVVAKQVEKRVKAYLNLN
jgi:predicted regulator of Ras-like GTPase activity (Roadblock/LC7/MglB family)